MSLQINQVDNELILQFQISVLKYVQKYKTAFNFTVNAVHLWLLKLIQESILSEKQMK